MRVEGWALRCEGQTLTEGEVECPARYRPMQADLVGHRRPAIMHVPHYGQHGSDPNSASHKYHLIS
jgi:hypothetical protein